VSATNRGAERISNDAYPTPSWCVRRLLDACPLQYGVWLEPCAGDGAIIDAVESVEDENQEKHGRRGRILWHGCEIRPEVQSHPSCVSWHMGSYLDQPFEGADVIITNPPFDLSFEIAQKAITEAPAVALLLRLNWLGSGTRSGRSAWLRKYTPDVYVLPNRPSFVQNAKGAWATDATEYAWFVWGHREAMARGGIHREPILRVLAETPKAERHAARTPDLRVVLP
jgi:hypothetical protein